VKKKKKNFYFTLPVSQSAILKEGAVKKERKGSAFPLLKEKATEL
jgi:hypothetical protein